MSGLSLSKISETLAFLLFQPQTLLFRIHREVVAALPPPPPLLILLLTGSPLPAARALATPASGFVDLGLQPVGRLVSFTPSLHPLGRLGSFPPPSFGSCSPLESPSPSPAELYPSSFSSSSCLLTLPSPRPPVQVVSVCSCPTSRWIHSL